MSQGPDELLGLYIPEESVYTFGRVLRIVF